MSFYSIANSLKLNKYLIVTSHSSFKYLMLKMMIKSIKLAEFAGGNVMVDEYLDHYLLSTQYKPEKLPTEENLIEIVEQKAFEKMSVTEAMDAGIDKDSLYNNILDNNNRRLLFQKYIQLEITNKIITDSLINKFYAEFSPQYKMRYIMRPFLESSSEQFISSQKDTIEQAYSMLKSGKTFKEVVEKYSQDISTNKKGGDLGWVIRESMGDEALRQVLDTLPDLTYSKPFKGYGGFYIMYQRRETRSTSSSF